MSFFAPFMLFGLVAAAAPIVLHLLRKRTADRLDWGAWMFIVETLRKKRRKLLIEDLLLLVLRTLVLALAAFAFARPFLPEFHYLGGAGVDKDVVIVLDTSASMQIKDDAGVSAFDRACEEIRELVETSPKGTSFGLVAGGETPEILTATPMSSRQEILDLLDRLEPRDGAMDAPRSLAAAGEILSAGANPGKAIVVYGDGQGYGWRADEASEWKRVERSLARFSRRPPVVYRALPGPVQTKNVALAELKPSRRVVGTDRPVGFSMTVVNSGSEAFAPGDAVVACDGEEIVRLPLGQILPGLSRTFEFPVAFTNEGPHRLVASLPDAGDDALPTDNTISNRVDVVGAMDVLLVNGHPSATGYDRPTALIEAALRPEIAGTNGVFLVRPRTVRAAELEKEETFGGVAAAVLCDVPFLSPRATTNLLDWVRTGGGVVTVAGPRCRDDYYTNEVVGAGWRTWDGAAKDLTLKDAPVVGRVMIDEAAIDPQADVLERFSDGSVAAVSSPFGRGRRALVACPLDCNWSAFPARPAFVPFVHEIVSSVAATNSFATARSTRWRAREGDLTPLTDKETDALSTSVDFGYARTKDDVLSAIIGRSFGLEFGRWVALVVLVLLALELLFCRYLDRTRGGLSPSKARFALRAIAVLALVWMLSHVTWVHDVSRPIHRRVALFTDVSLSMHRSDPTDDGGTNATVRLEVATDLAARLERELSDAYDVVPLTFGGETTDFAQALETALAEIPSEELAGAVFVTDGRQTADSSPEAASRRFARLGAKISSLVVGSETNRADAAIESVRAPEHVFFGDRIRPVVRVRADALKGRRLTVRLMEGDRKVDARELTVDDEAWTQEIVFADDPVEKGVKAYRVELDAPEDDRERENDVWPFDVAVSDDRTSVLMVDSRPRWEFRYLRNLFHGRDKSIHLQYLLTEPDRYAERSFVRPPAADATRAFGESEAGSLPKGRDDWRKFDVIVLGDLGPDILTDEVCDHLRACVEERGATLIVSAGARHMPAAFARAPLADLLPVVCTNEQGAVTAAWRNGPTALALTPSGRGHPATALAPTASENERLWQSVPPVRGRLTGIAPRPGAEVLLFAGDATPMAAPLMIVRQTGRGKVVFFATDETWMLRYRTGDTYHHRFWSNIVRWGAGDRLRDGNRHARVGTPSVHSRPGRPVRIGIRLRDAELLPIDGAKPVAEIVKPDGSRSTVDLAPKDGASGCYETMFDETVQEGRYAVTIVDRETAARLGANWPDPLETSFTVDRTVAPVEYAQLTADRRTVAEMARLTGGVVFEASDIPGIAGTFGEARREVDERIEDPIWDHPLALALFALALIAGWILRKRKGLA